MKIGNILLGDNPLFLAPMEDITDPSFRMICKMNGADFMYTEFVSSDGLIRDGPKSVKNLGTQISIKFFNAFLTIADQSVGGDEFRIHEIGAIHFANHPEGRIGYILHRSQK